MNEAIDSVFFRWVHPLVPERDVLMIQAAALAGGLSVVTGVGVSYLVYGRVVGKALLVGGAFPVLMLGAYGLWRFPRLRWGLKSVIVI